MDRFELVAELKECKGDEISKEWIPTLDECADQCTNVASMFVYGVEEKGGCQEEGCWCYCETAASVHGTCDQRHQGASHLYRFI